MRRQTSLARVPARKSEKGATLIEVVISILIMGIVGAAIVGYFTWSFGLFNRVDTDATAESLARSQMEKIKNDPFNAGGTYGLISNIPPDYTVSGNVTGNPTLFGGPVTGVAGLQRISIVVTRTYTPEPGTQRTQTLTLDGYKLDR